MTEWLCKCAGCTKAKKSGAEEERERIIALLEAEGCHCMPDPEAGKCYPHNLIAAIKGEN